MRTRTALLVLAGVLATGMAAAGAVVAVRAGEALPGTTVAGADVGGLGREDLRSRLETAAETRTTGTLELVHDELAFAVDRAELAIDIDVESTVDAALAAGREGGLSPVLGPLLGRGEQVDLASTVEDGPLREQVDQIAAQVDRQVFRGAIAVDDGVVTAQPPLEGRTVDREQAVDDLAEALLAGRVEPLPLPVEEVDPGATAADVEAVAAQAREVLAEPLRLTHPEATLELTPAELGPVLRAEPADGGGLGLGVDEEAFTELVTRQADALDRAPVPPRFAVPQPPTVDAQGDLTWTPRPAPVSVTPGQPGLDVDAAAAVEAARALLPTPQREAELPATVVPPAIGPGEAAASGIDQLMGTFTTYFAPGQPRVTNIRKIASVVDGTYVAPGERLSLNEVAGPRTRAKGYVADSAIINGELEDVVGGGVSQFATTLFNAAFFAGLPIEQHKPHSFYISRYPAGRESTVNFGSIDVRVRNDTSTGMVVKTWSTPRSVTVGIYGNNGGRTVTSTSGPREPRPGGGFSINVTRTISGGDGRGERRVFRTVYNPPPDS
ncbi:MAG TPA: VanW family protein [Mycobacteriales bacterium]|nr:VanW family protein [Mycobacteriales bacterium]